MAAVDAALADLLDREHDLLAELCTGDRDELAALLRRLLSPFEARADEAPRAAHGTDPRSL